MNNKRKEINNNDNDNDNDNKKITYKKFKKEHQSFKTSNHRELQTIAASLGLSKSGKKESLYKNIEKYLKNNNDKHEQEQEEEEKEEIEDEKDQHVHEQQQAPSTEVSELLFWKIFRNIVLFNKIFSNFTNKRLYGYNDISNDVEIIFSKFKNPLEIILDKIKSNSNNNNNNNNHNDQINDYENIEFIISNVTKDNKENRLFFNKLFSSSTQFKNEYEKWLNLIIACSNCIALDEYIKLFKIDYSKLDLSNQIDYDEFSFKKFKILNYLKLNISFPIDSFYRQVLSFSIKFKEIIKIHQFFINQFYKNNNNNNNEKINKLIIEINEIINKKEEQEEYLKFEINKILESSSGSGCGKLKELIFKIYKLIYKIYKLNDSDFKKPIDYYIYFKKDLEMIIKKIDELSNGRKKLYQYIGPLLKYNFKDKKERIELISIIFSDGNNENYYSFSNKTNTFENRKTFETISDIIMSSNEIDVIDHFFKLISSNSIPNLKDVKPSKTITSIIQSSVKVIKSKELLDYYLKNYQSEAQLLFSKNSFLWMDLPCFPVKIIDFKSKINSDQDSSNNDISILEHFESLMQSIDRKILVPYESYVCDDMNYIYFFNRAIKIGPSVYNISALRGNNGIAPCQLLESVLKYKVYIDNLKIETIISILSNVKLNNPLNLNNMFNNNYSNSLISKSIDIIKLLFNNISKELIEIKLRKRSSIDGYKKDETLMKFTTEINQGTNIGGDKIIFGEFIIEKPSFIQFYISFDLLLHCLYNLDRTDDIIYLFKSVPNILSNFKATKNTGSIKATISNFYDTCSNYYLNLFINYFINNLNNNNNNNNNNNINQLYHCLCIAAKKGFIQIFRNLISNYNNNNLFKIKSITTTSSSSSSLFESKLLYEIVTNSIISNNLELSNLLINNINFSRKDKQSLKSKLTK